jgi:hypothetical protein
MPTIQILQHPKGTCRLAYYQEVPHNRTSVLYCQVRVNQVPQSRHHDHFPSSNLHQFPNDRLCLMGEFSVDALTSFAEGVGRTAANRTSLNTVSIALNVHPNRARNTLLISSWGALVLRKRLCCTSQKMP